MTRITTTALRIEVCKLSRDTLSVLDRSPKTLSVYRRDILGKPSKHFRVIPETNTGVPIFPVIKGNLHVTL